MNTRLQKVITLLCTTLLVLTLAFCIPGKAVISSKAAGYTSNPELILNSIVLNPGSTGNAELDAVINSVLSQITTPTMSTYQKVKACYDYLIEHSSYGIRGATIMIPDGITADQYLAYEILTTGVGVCDHYAAAFAYMMRVIGIENSYTDGGYTSKAGGGYTPHAWAIIRVGGVNYVFDAQVEDNIAKGGTIKYYRFCKSYAEVSKNYSYDASGTPITSSSVSANGTSTVQTTYETCSIWSVPNSSAANRVKYVSEGYPITIYPTPILGSDGKYYFKTIRGSYVLAKCVW